MVCRRSVRFALPRLAQSSLAFRKRATAWIASYCSGNKKRLGLPKKLLGRIRKRLGRRIGAIGLSEFKPSLTSIYEAGITEILA